MITEQHKLELLRRSNVMTKISTELGIKKHLTFNHVKYSRPLYVFSRHHNFCHLNAQFIPNAKQV